MRSENISKIEAQTRWQNQNRLWYPCRRGVITASKAHEVFTKMKKVIKGTGGSVNLWELNQKISRLNFRKSRYTITEIWKTHGHMSFFFKKTHKRFTVQECGVVLLDSDPFIGASPDANTSCSSCRNSCIEVKCPYLISHTSPKDA